ncbi:condensation domain-containing protein, partial [Mycobacterium simulans]|uniref:condensation domain-containing protein n=1 Tax=Mycobacterium simulans TaxID=627089 RepID=UPI001CD771D7
HIVLDGWSMPILLREIFGVYHHQSLPAALPFRRFVSWLAGRDVQAARRAWGAVLAGVETPTLVGAADRLELGSQGVQWFTMPAEIMQALSGLARSCHTTVNTVLQAAWAQVLVGLTGQHDVVFGTTVSGRPAELSGADQMVGLLINTVPVRARLTAATTTVELVEQLQGFRNDTLEHQHLALSEIQRIAGQDKLFDTLFVYENYPLDTEQARGADALVITDVAVQEATHYPLSVQAIPGDELRLRIEYRTDVFDAASIEALVGRLRKILVAMTADPDRRLSSIDVLDP